MAWWESVLFLSDGRHGWEEQFFQPAGSIEQALDHLEGLGLARAKVTSAAVSIWKLRVSEVGVPRHSWTVAGGFLGRAGTPALPGTVGLLVSLAAGTRGLHRREYHVRGLPADFFTSRAVVAPQYQAALSGFLGTLADGTWYMQTNALLGPEVPMQDLGAWTLEGGNLLGIPVAGQKVIDGGTLLYAQTGRPPQPDADRVRVRGVRVSPATLGTRRAVNGVFPVAGQDGGGVYWQSGLATFTYQGGGLVQLQGRTWEPITEAIDRKQASRKTGPAPRGFAPVPAPFRPLSGPSLPAPAPAPAPTIFQRRAEWIWDTERTLRNLQDAAILCFEGYDLQPPGILEPIAIAPLVDYPHTWLVSVAGVNRTAENNQTLWNGYLSGLNKFHEYRDDVENAIGLEIPAGDKILWHGHSMGGIVGQNLAADEGFVASWPILAVVTWGSPTTAPERAGTQYYRFSEPIDLVSVDVAALLQVAGRVQKPQIHCDTSVPGLPKFDQHNDYPKSPTLLQVKPWQGLGSGVPGDVLRLGPITRYPAPV